MNYIDIIILIILALFIFGGVKKGLVRSAGEILGVFLAIYVAINFYGAFSSWLENTVSFLHGTMTDIVSVILLFIGVNVVVSIIVYFIDKIFSLPILNFFNHLLGGIFGLIEGALLVVVLFFILAYFGIGVGMFENSKAIPYVEKFSFFVKPLLPKDLKSVSISDFLENTWIYNLKNSINNLPDNINSVDGLVTYLRENIGIGENIISDIKDSQFKGKTNLTIDEIRSSLQDYLDNLK